MNKEILIVCPTVIMSKRKWMEFYNDYKPIIKAARKSDCSIKLVNNVTVRFAGLTQGQRIFRGYRSENIIHIDDLEKICQTKGVQ